MPLKKLCKCGVVIEPTKRYCDKCQVKYEQQKSQNNKLYDMNVRQQRDKLYTEFYHSKEWEHLKLHLKNKYIGLCLWSYFIDSTIRAADTYHHIEPIKDRWDLRLKDWNVIPLTDSIHNRVEAMYKTDKKGTQKILRELLDKWNALKG